MSSNTMVLAVALLAGTAARSSAQVLTGRVLDADSGQPIAGAAVSALARGQAVLTTESDRTGVFRLILPRPGWYGVGVERLGYAPATSDTLSIGVGETVEIAIRLSVTAVPLAPLTIVERRTSHGTHREFYRRLESGLRSGHGAFITRAMLDSTKLPSVTSVLAGVPNVGMVRDAPVILSRGGCQPTLYLNGARLQLGPGESIDNRFALSDLEGVEIYRDRAELPFEFTGIDQCGAILFWTRAGQPTRGRSWRFLAAGGLLLGFLVLFVAT